MRKKLKVMLIQSSHLILDTCCILNFLASGYFLPIVTVIPAQVVITQTVWEQELMDFRKFDDKDKQQIDDAINQDIVRFVDFESEAETDLFVNYTAILRGDGESASASIAILRNWAIATDDKASINLFLQDKPNLEIFSTPEIIKYWAEKENLSFQILKTVLTDIQVKGRYFPAKNHPLKQWWTQTI